MNIKSILLSVFALGVMLVAVITADTEKKGNEYYFKAKQEESVKEAAEARGAAEYFNGLWANQHTGEIDINDINAAYYQANAMLKNSSKKRGTIPNLVWEERGPDNIGGRTRGVYCDRTDSNILYMGMVTGGFFRSTDRGNTWVKVGGNDSSRSMTISTVAQAANGDIYYGTGESFGGVSLGSGNKPGNGVFKSTDGGLTFTHLPTTAATFNSNSSTWHFVNKLVAHPTDANKIYAATNRGLYVTTDAGATWSPLVSISTRFVDVEISSDGSVILASTSNNIFLSTDGGANFLQGINTTSYGLPGTGGLNRVEVAIAPSNENVLYALMSVPGGTKGCYRSIDKGANWTTIGLGGTQLWNPLGDQGYYDITLGVHPTNSDMLFLGGQLDLYRWTPTANWEPIAYWIGSPQSGTRVHADMHGIMFNSGNPDEMYVVTDGGFYKTEDCTLPNPYFIEKNKNYSTAQCYGVAANRLGHIIFGTQDNGTNLINGSVSNSPQTSKNVLGGDGMRGAASDMFTNVLFGEIQNGVLRRATDGGVNLVSFKNIFDYNIDGDPTDPTTVDGEPDEGSLWVAPVLLKEQYRAAPDTSKSVLFFGLNSHVWFTQDAAKPEVTWFPLISIGGPYSSIAVSDDGKTAFAGTANGVVYRITGIDIFGTKYVYDNDSSKLLVDGFSMGNSFNVTTVGSYGRYITDLECSSEGDTLLITVPNYGNSTYIYRSVNAKAASPTVTSIQGNLPRMPIYSAAFLSGNSCYLVGTELGVFGTEDGGATWTEMNNIASGAENTWHPRCMTTQIEVKKSLSNTSGNGYSGDLIYTGTYGRGTYLSKSASTMWPVSTNDVSSTIKSLSVYPNPVMDVANVNYVVSKAGDASIQVISLTGKVLRTEVADLIIGDNKISIDMSGLSRGVYVLVVKSPNGLSSTKVIKR